MPVTAAPYGIRESTLDRKSAEGRYGGHDRKDVEVLLAGRQREEADGRENPAPEPCLHAGRRSPRRDSGGRQQHGPWEGIAEDHRQVERQTAPLKHARALREALDVLPDHERLDIRPAVLLVQERVPRHDDRGDDHDTERQHQRLHAAEVARDDEVERDRECGQRDRDGPLRQRPETDPDVHQREIPPAVVRIALAQRE
jgi:hypothetical protein